MHTSFGFFIYMHFQSYAFFTYIYAMIIFFHLQLVNKTRKKAKWNLTQHSIEIDFEKKLKKFVINKEKS